VRLVRSANGQKSWKGDITQHHINI